MEPTAECIRAAQAGDDAAFTRLVRAVYPHVYRWALTQMAAPDDADDVAQAALVSMHRRLAEFRHDSRFTTWLYAIVRRASADWRRGSRRRLAREKRYVDELPPEHEEDTGLIDARRSIRAVHAMLRDLPVRQREVFDLAELQGMAHADVSRMLGLQPATVRVHLLRARRTIRKRLLEQDTRQVEQSQEPLKEST